MKNIKNDRTNYVLSIYFLQSRQRHWAVVHVFVFFLKTASDVSSFRKLGISSQIFGANE